MKKSNCLYCGIESVVGRNTYGKYCNNQCQADHRYETFIEDWKNGRVSGVRGKATTPVRFVGGTNYIQ